MRYEIEVNGRMRRVTVRRADGSYVVIVDDREYRVESVRLDPQTLSLLIETDERAAPGSAPPTHLRTESREVTVAAQGAGKLAIAVGSQAFAVSMNGLRGPGKARAAQSGNGPERITAPMPGKVVRILAQVGTEVKARQSVVVIEAMKMENELRASRDGVMYELHAREGQSVDAGTLLAVIAPAAK